MTSANSVALGSNSSADGTTLTTAAYGVGGTATAGGEVNIANGANGRRITGLAAGARATDAVNVSQLNQLGQSTATALGGGTALNATTGAWTAPSYSTNSINAVGTSTGPLISTNVGAALTNLNTSLTNTAAVAVKYDDASTKTQVTFNPAGTAVKLTNVAVGTLNATSTDAVNGSQLFAASQNTATALGGGAAVNATTGAWTAPSYSTNSISVNGTNTGPLVSNNVGAALTNLNTSLTNTAAVAVKYDDASTKTQVTFNPAGAAVKLTNVAVGVLNATSTDAVNGSQLFAASQNTATALGGGAAVNATTGAWTAPSYSTNSISVNGTNTGPLVSTNVGAALTNLNTSLSNTAAVAVKYDDASTKTQVTFNPAGTAVKLTNVAVGTLNATSTDAVNGSQLFAASQNTATALGGGAAVNATTGAWTAPSYSTNSISVNGTNTGPLVSTNVGAALTNLNTSLTNTAAVAVKYDDAATKTQVTFNPAGTAVKLTNVAAGTLNGTSTDAVNGSQLFATNQTVDNLVNNGAGVKYFHSNSTLADSSATGLDSVAIGPAANATVANGVALGSNSLASGATLANAAYGVGGAATGGEVNIANGANGRRLTGLAAGSSATDAINVSQLNQSGQNTATALGGGAALDATTGAWTAPSYSTNSISVNGTNTGPLVSTNVGAALTNLNTSLTNTAAVAVKYDDASTKTQVTFNPAGTAVKLTNVAAGTLNGTSTDAVNGSQLFATNQTVDNLVNNGAGVKYFHGNSVLADSSATGLDSVAIGPTASSTAANAVAIGNGAIAGTANSIALGNGATTATANATANGVINGATFNYAGATPTGVLSIGSAGGERQITNVAAGRVSATSTDAVNGSQLFSTNSAVDGLGAQVNNLVNNGAGVKYFHSNSTLADSSATGLDSVAIGPAASATVANGVALGSNSLASGGTLANAAYGVGGAASGGEVNIANGANGRRLTGLAAGSSATDAINVSQLNQSGQNTATALGGGAAVNATTGAWTAPSYSTNSISVNGTNTGPLVSTNVGAALTNLNTSLTNTAAVAVKYDDASTKTQVTFNPAGTAVKLTNVAAGTLNGTSSDAVNGSQLFATNQTVDNLVNNGAGVKYFHSNSTLADSSATGQDSVAIGPAASATVANGVALGSNSLATGATLANAAYGVGGAATGGEVNIANGANGRRITGLAAGSSATDAVNVSQLNQSGQNTATALGGGAALDATTGAWTAPSYSTNSISVNGTNTGPLVSTNVGAALTNLNTSLTNTASVAVKYDDASTKTQVTFNPAGTAVKLTNVAAGTLNGTSTDAVNGSQLFATNQTVDNLVNNGAGVKYFHSNSTLADSSATGLDSVAIGPAASATVANGVALGSNSLATGATLANAAYGVGGAATGGEVNIANGANGRRLTGLAAGSSATDAVNVSQLNQSGQNTATALGGGAALDATTGAWTAPSYSTNSISVNGTNTGPLVSTNVGAALTNLNTSLTNTASVAVKYDDASTKTQVTFNPAGTAVKLSNVAAGTLNGTSTDAVNGSQLFATNQTVDNLVNNGAGVKYFHSNSTLADSSATGQDSVAVGPAASSTAADSVALGSHSSATGTTLVNAAYGVGGAATGGEVNIANGADGRRLTGLAAGSSNTDAVNVSQLNLIGQSAAMALGGGAQLDATTGVWTAPVYVTNSINATGANTGPLTSNNVGAALTDLNTSVTNTAAVAVKYDDATKAQVTFNPAGAATKLTNVAAGNLNGTSTDAVNGSQLFATNEAVDNIINSGTGIKYFHANSTLADSTATGLNSMAIGPQSIATGAYSFAAGPGANVAADGGLALGHQSQVQVAGGIALGEGSVADRALAPATGTIPVGSGAIIYDTSDATLLGSVSVGKAGSYRQITNVADATDDHDAVTLRQLTGAMGSLSSTGTLYFHANSTNPVDSLASGAESIAVGPATVVNGDNGVGIGNQATVGQAAAGGIAIGRNTQVLQASGIAMGSAAQASAEQSVALGAGANASQAMSVALGSSSITTVGAQTDYSAYRLAAPQTSVGEVGIGTALGNRKLTGVAAGTQDNDAVNVAQLKSVGDQVDQNTTDITTLGGRVGGLETLIGAGGGIKYLHVNSINADSAATGTDSMALGSQAQASGNGSVAMGNGAKASADGSVAVGSGASDEGRGAETYSGKYSGANNVTSGTVSVGNTATGATRTVSNVADGKDANDAVNVRQLDGAVAESKQYTDDSIANLNGAALEQGARISTVEGDVSNIKNGTDGMFQVSNGSAAAKPKATGVNSIAGGAGAVASGKNSAAVGTQSQATGENSVAMGNGAKATARNATALGANSVADRENSVSMGSVGNERQLTNIAAGTSGTDAVNVDQLTKSVAGLTDSANAYTDQRYSELKNDIKKQDEVLSAGIAGAMAMASLPQSYSPGASMTTVAASTYRGQSSVAFGVSHLSGNGRWLTKLQGSTDTQRNVGVAVGVGYQW
ncbi:YadA-like family protein [Pseudomonas frederiksbergensis]|uniref:YadA-like family protein n=1 Tax=Pseudomonas frederiksbergensis TaxID=104087 RepID=UPI003D065C93